MCYTIFLSTSRGDDLTLLSGEAFSIERVADDDPEEILALLGLSSQMVFAGALGWLQLCIPARGALSFS